MACGRRNCRLSGFTMQLILVLRDFGLGRDTSLLMFALRTLQIVDSTDADNCLLVFQRMIFSIRQFYDYPILQILSASSN